MCDLRGIYETPQCVSDISRTDVGHSKAAALFRSNSAPLGLDVINTSVVSMTPEVRDYMDTHNMDEVVQMYLQAIESDTLLTFVLAE